MPHYDAIVLGLGVMGSSAAMHLALRGKRVLGVDQHPLGGHTRGSSHGHSRMIRMCYYEHPDYVPLLRRSYELWRELEQHAGTGHGSLLRETGGIYMGPAGSSVVVDSARSAELHSLDHEILSRAELADRFPQFKVGDEFVGLYEPRAGYLLPEAVVAAQQAVAKRTGAELYGKAPATWAVLDGRVEVLMPKIESADTVIITPGAWANQLIPDLGVQIKPTRQILGWVLPPQPARFAEGSFPVWAIDASHLNEGLYYGFPIITSRGQPPGLKLARHAPGPECATQDLTRLDWTIGEQELFRPCLRRWMPEADGPVAAMVTCMYENSPDGHFIIDRHPKHANILIACGFSGHGFKFGSVVGEILADLATDGRTRHPIGFLGLDRFSRASRPPTR